MRISLWQPVQWSDEDGKTEKGYVFAIRNGGECAVSIPRLQQSKGVMCDALRPAKATAAMKKVIAKHRAWWKPQFDPNEILEAQTDPHFQPILSPMDVYDVRCVKNTAWLTIGDVMPMVPGEVLELVSLDRNMYDMLDALVPEATPMMPQKFFEAFRAVYVHQEGLRGTLTLHTGTGDGALEPLELTNFEFHVNYTFCRWFPLIGGVLPAVDPQSRQKIIAIDTPWESMDPDSTAIGYRGPLLKWEIVKNWNRVFYWRI